jgi:hypothetical protein
MKIMTVINMKLIIPLNIKPLAGQEGSYIQATDLYEEEQMAWAKTVHAWKLTTATRWKLNCSQ